MTAYATLADLRSAPELKLATGETADDTLLSALLESVARHIDRKCNRTFAASSDGTRYFDAVRDVDWHVASYNGHPRRLLLNEDLCAITSITNGDSVAVAVGEYVTEPRNVLTVDNGAYEPIWAIDLKQSANKYWTYTMTPENAITIVGKWAYSTSAPEAIKRANIMGAAALYRNSLSGDADRPIVAGGGIVIEPSRMPRMFYDLINPYVKRM